MAENVQKLYFSYLRYKCVMHYAILNSSIDLGCVVVKKNCLHFSSSGLSNQLLNRYED